MVHRHQQSTPATQVTILLYERDPVVPSVYQLATESIQVQLFPHHPVVNSLEEHIDGNDPLQHGQSGRDNQNRR